jgi:hypothetical protein
MFTDLNRVNTYKSFRCTWYLVNITVLCLKWSFCFLNMWISNLADIHLHSFILLVLVSGMSMPLTSCRHWDSRLQNTRKLFEEGWYKPFVYLLISERRENVHFKSWLSVNMFQSSLKADNPIKPRTESF